MEDKVQTLVIFHLGEGLICPASNPYEEISDQYHTRSQSTNCASSEDQPQWSPPTAGGRWRNSAVTHLESSVTTYIPSYLLYFCETKIHCLLKSRQRFELNDFYLTTLFTLCSSYQAFCWNRKNCIIFISLVTCKCDMTSCLESLTTYLDRHPGYSRRVSFHWL